MIDPRDFLTEYGISPNKALGQNFLTDAGAIERIVSLAAEPRLPILEIGPGLGALTFPLANTGLPLAAVELDGTLCGILREKLPENAFVVNSDFLKADLEDIISKLGGGGISIVGNLPYYITSPICMRLMTSGVQAQRMTLMMQREAAERFSACPGDKNYVPLTVLARYLFEVTRVFELSPASYWPQPDVSSTVLLFESRGKTLPAGLVTLTKCAFAMRRKTLQNNLCAMGLSKAEAASLIEKAGLSPSVRAEALDVDDFVRLAGLMQ